MWRPAGEPGLLCRVPLGPVNWRKVEVTRGFLLLMAWLNYLDRQRVVPMALLAGLFHELGHYWTIRTFGGKVRRVRLTAVGAEMELSRSLDYRQEGVAALAGPGVNLLLAVVFCRWGWGYTFAGLNLILACFNLAPVGQLDGGRALYCTLALALGKKWADQVGATLNRFGMAMLLICGVLVLRHGGGITLLLTAVWLLLTEHGWKKRGIRACQTDGKRVK